VAKPLRIPARVARTSPETLLKSYILASQDLMLASRSCEAVEKHSPNEADELYYFLTLSAVICYARPFSGNRPAIRLPRACTQFRTPAQLDAHKTALATRNHVYAHSYADVRSVKVTPDAVDVYTHGTDSSFVHRFRMETRFQVFPATKLPCLREAISLVKEKLQLEISLLRDKVHAARGRPLEPFELGKP
jgi:hypothetical protein